MKNLDDYGGGNQRHASNQHRDPDLVPHKDKNTCWRHPDSTHGPCPEARPELSFLTVTQRMVSSGEESHQTAHEYIRLVRSKKELVRTAVGSISRAEY